MRVIDSHLFVRPRPPKHVTKARENGSKAATTHTVTMKEKIIFETSEPLTLVAPKRLKVDRGTSPSNMKVKARVAWRYVMQHFIDVPRRRVGAKPTSGVRPRHWSRGRSIPRGHEEDEDEDEDEALGKEVEKAGRKWRRAKPHAKCDRSTLRSSNPRSHILPALSSAAVNKISIVDICEYLLPPQWWDDMVKYTNQELHGDGVHA